MRLGGNFVTHLLDAPQQVLAPPFGFLREGVELFACSRTQVREFLTQLAGSFSSSSLIASPPPGSVLYAVSSRVFGLARRSPLDFLSKGSWYVHVDLSLVAVFSALAYAVLGGVFLAFSDFIMRALDRVSKPTGVDTMQAINRQVVRALFMPLFIGMAPVSLLLIVHEIGWGVAPSPYMIIGAGVLYLLGCFISTAARNVSLNQALATMDSSSSETHRYWREVY